MTRPMMMRRVILSIQDVHRVLCKDSAIGHHFRYLLIHVRQNALMGGFDIHIQH